MAIVSSAGLPKTCHASQRSRKKSSDSLLRDPFGRPAGLPDCPGLNWVNSLPVTCFPPVDSGLLLTISVHRIRSPVALLSARSVHRIARPHPLQSGSSPARPWRLTTLPDALDPRYCGDGGHQGSL